MDFGWATIKFEDKKSKDKNKSRKGKHVLDFSTTTSIHKTARMIRNDIRLYKISYFNGMVILIQARNNLKKMLANEKKKDKEEKEKFKIKDLEMRIRVLEREIRFTKKDLMEKYGNPETLIKNRGFDSKKLAQLGNMYRPVSISKHF